MTFRSLLFILFSLCLWTPTFAAQSVTNTGNNQQIINTGNNQQVISTGNTGHSFAYIVSEIVQTVGKGIPILYALAFLYFVAGMARYFFMGQGEENREKGKQMMLYGLIGLVVMFVIWGVVNGLIGVLTSLGGVSAQGGI
jgi:hypothetical protein